MLSIFYWIEYNFVAVKEGKTNEEEKAIKAKVKEKKLGERTYITWWISSRYGLEVAFTIVE